MKIRLICTALYLALMAAMFVSLNRSKPPLSPTPAAFTDKCGKVHPDLLDGTAIRGGQLRLRRGSRA